MTIVGERLYPSRQWTYTFPRREIIIIIKKKDLIRQSLERYPRTHPLRIQMWPLLQHPSNILHRGPSQVNLQAKSPPNMQTHTYTFIIDLPTLLEEFTLTASAVLIWQIQQRIWNLMPPPPAAPLTYVLLWVFVLFMCQGDSLHWFLNLCSLWINAVLQICKTTYFQNRLASWLLRMCMFA